MDRAWAAIRGLEWRMDMIVLPEPGNVKGLESGWSERKGGTIVVRTRRVKPDQVVTRQLVESEVR